MQNMDLDAAGLVVVEWVVAYAEDGGIELDELGFDELVGGRAYGV